MKHPTILKRCVYGMVLLLVSAGLGGCGLILPGLT